MSYSNYAELQKAIPASEEVDEGIKTVGEEIALNFYCGNFNDGVKSLRNIYCSAKDFLDYLENEAEERDTTLDNLYSNHFSFNFWICLGAEMGN